MSAVSEDVFFGNPNFNSNGHDQKILLPTLNQLSFSDQQSARANRRLDVAYGADNTFSWFVPNKAGDHDFKVGFNYLWSSLRVQDFGNMNATFTIPSDLAFDAANPRTYPERLSIRVPSAVDFLMKGHFIGLFAAGQVAAEQPPDPEPRRALRRRDSADAEPGESDVHG